MRFGLVNRVAAVAAAIAAITAASGAWAADSKKKEDVCQGHDMLEEVRTSSPDTYAKVMAEAAATQNADAILWKVERDGGLHVAEGGGVSTDLAAGLFAWRRLPEGPRRESLRAPLPALCSLDDANKRYRNPRGKTGMPRGRVQCATS